MVLAIDDKAGHEGAKDLCKAGSSQSSYFLMMVWWKLLHVVGYFLPWEALPGREADGDGWIEVTI